MRPFLRSPYAALVGALISIGIGWILHKSDFVELDSDTGDELAEVILSKEDKLYTAIQDVQAQIFEDGANLEKLGGPLLGSTLEEDGFTLLIYEKDTLRYWSNNTTPAPVSLPRRDSIPRIWQLENGWYHSVVAEKDSLTFLGLSLIKNSYRYSNKYLTSDFQEDFIFPFESTIKEGRHDGIVVEDGDEALFTVIVDDKTEKALSKHYFIAILYAIGLVLLVYYLRLECHTVAKKVGSIHGILVFTVFTGLLRYFMLEFEFPAVFYELELFQPTLYATSFYFPSLGDFLINAYLFFYLAYFIFREVRLSSPQPAGWLKKMAAVVVFILFIVLFAASTWIRDLTFGLVENSQIYLNINNLFSLDFYSFTGIMIIGLLYFGFFVLCNLAMYLIIRLKVERNRFYLYLVLSTALFLIYDQAYGSGDLLIGIWPALILAITSFVWYGDRPLFSFAPIVGVLVVFSLVSAHSLYIYTSQKEKKDRIAFASKLSSEEEPVTELLFAELKDSLRSDPLVFEPFIHRGTYSKREFDRILEKNYFNEYWDQYDIRYMVFDSDSMPVGADLNADPPKFEDLMSTIESHGVKSDIDRDIYYIRNYRNKLSYMFSVDLMRNDSLYGYLFAELRSKKIPEDIGFPELLIDKNTRTIEELANYSYVRYVDSNMVSNIGSYSYTVEPAYFIDRLEGKVYTFFNEDDFNHLVYRASDNSVIILSKPSENWLSQATTFSYLFALFGLIALLGIIIRQLPKGLSLLRLNLKSRIQFLMVGLVLVSLVLYGIGTRYFIENQYTEKNRKLISEKIESVSVEVTQKLKMFEDLRDNNMENYLNYLMNKFSNVFSTDINLYDTDGNLLATSRHEIFYAGLQSKKMDPTAYREMKYLSKSEFVHQEEIGKMNYLSAYVPFFNEKGEILAFLNVPYFAKQNPLENEISNFLVAIINIFVLLFALSIVSALFISNWVTAPLRMLQSSLARIELGKSNKPIEYDGQDEIGSLVQEYNKKVLELEEAASQLAKTERESAWREMAKQVAHEIKNPLTPMKLNIQHLQRSFDPDDPKSRERLDRFAKTLIEQIDALTHIANEFSNFAKMPTAQMEEVDLQEVLMACTDLYTQTDRVSVNYDSRVTGKANVRYDKDHLVRVFNNLLKNAEQAIPDDKAGQVDVILTKEGENYKVEVRDNGTGIDEENIDKIFVPNFTTKSKGTGLGLAMVKNIAQNAGGDVYFETKQNEGTSFFVILPIFKG